MAADGFTCDDPAEMGNVLDAALQSPGPAVVRGRGRSVRTTDAAQGNLEQAYHFAEALARGTPERMKIISTIAKDTVREMI